LEIKPTDPWSWYQRGEVLRKLGRNTEAVASYDQVLASDPDDEYAWYNQACCYALLGNPDCAIASLQAAIRLNPSEYLTLAQTDSDFDHLRGHEPFAALLKG
jgi:tetratricopeptide (TPR) repeat protein